MCSQCGGISSSKKLNVFRLCRVPVARAVRKELLEGNSSTGDGSAAVILRFNLQQMESAEQ